MAKKKKKTTAPIVAEEETDANATYSSIPPSPPPQQDVQPMDPNANPFEAVLTNPDGVKARFLGEDYPYYKYIKEPSAIGMSSKGSLDALGKNITGLTSYVQLLVSGKSKASAVPGGNPMGNKFFMQTGGKCTDVETQTAVPRSMYINNVPQGNIPFISSGLGVNFTEFRGLIPGVISNLNAFNPMMLMRSFLEGSQPDCKAVELETINNHNVKSKETHYISLVDLQHMDPCDFPNNRNPITEQKCRETFSPLLLHSSSSSSSSSVVLEQLFWAGIGLIGIYLLTRPTR